MTTCMKKGGDKCTDHTHENDVHDDAESAKRVATESDSDANGAKRPRCA